MRWMDELDWMLFINFESSILLVTDIDVGGWMDGWMNTRNSSTANHFSLLINNNNAAATSNNNNERSSSSKIKRDCSTPLSNRVREILNHVVYSFVDYNEYKLPSTCVFNKNLDMLAVFQSLKFLQNDHQYRCKSCSKQFKSEDYIDQHLKNNHADLIPSNATICLGDYCEMLNCNNDYIISCDERKMEKLKYACQGIMYNCFPPSVNKNYNKHFNALICDKLTCKGGSSTTGQDGIIRDADIEEKQHQWSLMKYLSALVILVILIIFYLILWFFKKETRHQKDLPSSFLANRRRKHLLKELEKKNF
ncbi:hypothetical protein DFA_11183 [Cavenderia fasciculata]|uniref:C2H2-type domain-containing protein n=1 Tax=Cavenderia fasciculata TaxID=261658 RepID=F4QFB5_CACFS|nr:uncharacterized protein DFA_11183 [Cavenderia fasciculata]EGG13422.1 hypothetical protein DFA_11183 [Cavenderia fasciculata]|eukprot:XP_004350126.1 hypothetical protein DFA_11183 [Cavenderia fasciculata]